MDSGACQAPTMLASIRLIAPLVVLAALLAACPSEGEEAPTPFVVVGWSDDTPSLADVDQRGVGVYRMIAHLHSPHSHDACDGDPQPGGELDEECLAQLKAGLCATRIDVAFLSDHRTHANEAPTFEDLLLLRGGDLPVTDAEGNAIANSVDCGHPDGRRVLLIPGIEAEPLMPLGTTRRTPDLYDHATPENVEELRGAGALAWIAHAETLDPLDFLDVPIDGLELYQLHANLAPDLRELLGLEPFGFAADLGPFLVPRDGRASPEPDLAFLGFGATNEPAATFLETVGAVRPLGVTAGSDSHRNVLPTAAWDGERIDSYRRSFRWVLNHLYIDGALTPESAKRALRSGRNMVVVESIGTPLGFDFHARGTALEMGGEGPAEGATLHVRPPTLDPRSPRDSTPPEIRTVLFRAHEGVRTTLAEVVGDAPIDVSAPGPGVYRVEVWITPAHLAPYLGDWIEEYSSREVPWIQSGAIFLR